MRAEGSGASKVRLILSDTTSTTGQEVIEGVLVAEPLFSGQFALTAQPGARGVPNFVSMTRLRRIEDD